MRSQRLAILEYARKHDFRIDDFIEATASGQASEKRRRLDELMNVLQRGDRLVVSELSRLGRSLGQIVACVAIAATRRPCISSVLSFWSFPCPLISTGPYPGAEGARRTSYRTSRRASRRRGYDDDCRILRRPYPPETPIGALFRPTLTWRIWQKQLPYDDRHPIFASVSVQTGGPGLEVTQVHTAMYFSCPRPGQDIGRLQDRLAAAGPAYCNEEPVSLGIITQLQRHYQKSSHSGMRP